MYDRVFRCSVVNVLLILYFSCFIFAVSEVFPRVSLVIITRVEMIVNRFFHFFYFSFSAFTGQLKVFSTNKPVDPFIFNRDLFTGYYFCYGKSAPLGHKTE